MSLTQAPDAATGTGEPDDADVADGVAGADGAVAASDPDRTDAAGGEVPARPDWRIGLGVFGLYLALSVLTWSRVWFTGHPTTTISCGCGDPAEEVWFLRWFAYAVTHGHNPFLSGSMFAPQGFNVLDSTSFLLPAALLTPVTWLFGPVATFNVAATLAPAVSASCTYLAGRRWIAWRPAAVVCGLLVGFGPMITDNAPYGHLMLVVLCFPPLMVLLLDDLLVRQTRGWKRTGVLLGLVVVAQFFTGTEMLVICLVLGASGVVFLMVANPRRVRGQAPYALRGAAVAGGLAAVLLAYPLWFAVLGPNHFDGIYWPYIASAGTSTLHQMVFAGTAHTGAAIAAITGYFGPVGPAGSYLGVPLLLFVAAGLVAYRRVRVLWLWAALFAWATVLSLGIALQPVRDPSHTRTWWLPWNAVSSLPILRNVLPDRFGGVAVLFVALMLGIVLDRLRTTVLRWWDRRDPSASPVARRWLAGVAVVVLGLGVLYPVYSAQTFPYVVHATPTPAWFTEVAPGLPAGTTVLAIPYPSSGLVQPSFWQAQADLRYREVGGFAFVPDPDDPKIPDYNAPGAVGRMLSDLTFDAPGTPTGTPSELAAIRALVVDHGVDIVVVTGTTGSPTYSAGLFTAVLGRLPTWSHGAWVWDAADRDTAPPHPLGPTTLADCTEASAGSSDPLAVPRCVLAS